MPDTGNYMPYVHSLRSRGHEISLYGSDSYQFSRVLPMDQQVLFVVVVVVVVVVDDDDDSSFSSSSALCGVYHFL